MKRTQFSRVLFFVVIMVAAFGGFVIGEDTQQRPPLPEKSKMTQDFSVWLIPRYDDQNYLPFKKCIDDLSSRHEIARRDFFTPHITIFWGTTKDISLRSIAKKIKKIAAVNIPIILNIAGIGTSRERFKSLFLTFMKEPTLYAWSEDIGKTVGIQKTGYILMPHLSLFYPKKGMEMPFDKKLETINYVMEKYAAPLKWFTKNELPHREFNSGFPIVFDRIQLRREDDGNEVSTWLLLDEYVLTGEKEE